MSFSTEGGEIAQTLARWRSEAKVAQELSIASGVATREEMVTLTGMEFFAAMMKGKLPPPPITTSSEFLLISFDHGHVIMQGSPRAQFRNTLGITHGGWIATIMDSAVGCAVHTTLSVGMGYATAELKVSYLRPLSEEIGLVRAEGKVLSIGKKIAFAEGTLYGPDGKKYAHATTTCAVFSATS